MRRRLTDGQSLLDHSRADPVEHFPGFRLGPHGAEQARAGSDHRGGLVLESAVGEWARRPVERVLELPGDRALELGGGDQDGVGRAYGLPQSPDGIGRVLFGVL
jgi:hypothetical protein